MIDWDAALRQITRDAAAESPPVLAYEDLVSILSEEVTYVTWAAGTAYEYGAVVAPTIPNGHVYRATVGGTSDATAEPSWPLFSTVDPRPGLTRPYWAFDYGMIVSTVTDGTVTWVEAGPLPPAPWNLRRATARAWRLKAQRTSTDIAYRAGQLSIGPDTTHARCLAEAVRWETDIA